LIDSKPNQKRDKHSTRQHTSASLPDEWRQPRDVLQGRMSTAAHGGGSIGTTYCRNKVDVRGILTKIIGRNVRFSVTLLCRQYDCWHQRALAST